MRQHSIRTKLFAGFGIVLAVMVLTSAFSFYFNVKINRSYQELLDNEVAITGLVKSMNINIEKEHAMVTEYLLTSEEKFLDAYYEAKQSFFGNVRELSVLVTAEGDDWQQLQALDLLQEFFSTAVEQMFDAKKENNSASYMKILAEQGDTIEAFTDIASQLVERNQEALDLGVNSASAEARSIQFIMWGVVAAGFLIGAA
ncbi:MAG: chemotaxis protein, partial [Paenibacillaceae bacterium]|nr:chemotaxis protein [Paenibacillaceae bacterium]